jgi:hypothetical protein
MVFRYHDFVYLIQKDRFIEFIQAQDRGTFFIQHFGRDSALHTAFAVSYLMGLAYPYFCSASVMADTVDETFAADTALDFPREAGGIQRFIG